jgi:hypothetical protein
MKKRFPGAGHRLVDDRAPAGKASPPQAPSRTVPAPTRGRHPVPDTESEGSSGEEENYRGSDASSGSEYEARPNRRREQFCQYFMAGYCRDGANCNFKHYIAGSGAEDYSGFHTFHAGGQGHRLGDDSHEVDRHEDVDVDSMTYEELLALEERMGKAEQPTQRAQFAGRRLPVVAYVPIAHPREETGEDTSERTRCCICLADFEMSEDLTLFPCFHRFHPKCASAWFATGKGECPICKVDISQTGSTEYY